MVSFNMKVTKDDIMSVPENEDIKVVSNALDTFCRKNDCPTVTCGLCQTRILYLAGWRPQKTAGWVRNANMNQCSCCGYEYFSNNDKFKYCPSCGAKMSEE